MCEHTSHSILGTTGWPVTGIQVQNISRQMLLLPSLVSGKLDSCSSSSSSSRRSVLALTALLSPVGSRRSTHTLATVTWASDLQWHVSSVTTLFLPVCNIVTRHVARARVHPQVLGHVCLSCMTRWQGDTSGQLVPSYPLSWILVNTLAPPLRAEPELFAETLILTTLSASFASKIFSQPGHASIKIFYEYILS